MSHAIELVDKLRLLGLDHGHNLLVIRTAAASPDACRQGREGSRIAVTQLAPQPLDAAGAWGSADSAGWYTSACGTVGKRQDRADTDAESAGRRLDIQTMPTGARHRLIPEQRHTNSIDPKIASPCGELIFRSRADVFARLLPLSC